MHDGYMARAMWPWQVVFRRCDSEVIGRDRAAAGPQTAAFPSPGFLVRLRR